MDTTKIPREKNIVPPSQDEDKVSQDEIKVSWEDEFQQLMQTLPKEKTWYGLDLYFYEGFWCPSNVFKAVISFQKHFLALDSDIIVTSFPKCGTTWLKALTFSIVNRNRFAMEENPLLNLGPHQLVRLFEYDLYLNNPSPDLEKSSLYHPRLLSTHIPYASLPSSIKDSNSKIVYICRNPMDTFISLWFFVGKHQVKKFEPSSIDEAFEKFCQNIYTFGPFFDHLLGYWKASQENPNKILFLQYEDLKENIICHLKKLAMFLGFPFSEEEEKQGVVEEIAEMCSFENLKELDVNKNGMHVFGFSHKYLFRKAKVGDWRNYLTPAMEERLKKLIEENFDKSGLKFKLSCKSPDDACA